MIIRNICFYFDRGVIKGGINFFGVIYYGLKELEFGYYSSSLENDYMNLYLNGSLNNWKNFLGKGGVKFCYECGIKYLLLEVKFCCECGVRRMGFI